LFETVTLVTVEEVTVGVRNSGSWFVPDDPSGFQVDTLDPQVSSEIASQRSLNRKADTVASVHFRFLPRK